MSISDKFPGDDDTVCPGATLRITALGHKLVMWEPRVKLDSTVSESHDFQHYVKLFL